MKIQRIAYLIVPALTLISCSKLKPINAIKTFYVNDTLETVTNKSCRVAILYGQSNATGVASSSELQKHDVDKYNEYNIGYSNVKINYFTDNGSNTSNSTFIDTKLGAGASPDFFGPEIGMAEKYSTINTTDDIFIIKYTWSGSCLDNQWLNSKYEKYEIYEAAINFTRTSLDYLKSKGYAVKIDGICWMQGESDSSKKLSKKYYKNTETFVGFLRDDLKYYCSDIKFIDAYIQDIDIWKKYDIVNNAKLKYSETNILNFCIDTIALDLTTLNEPEYQPDIYHYDSTSMIKLGQSFGDILVTNN